MRAPARRRVCPSVVVARSCAARCSRLPCALSGGLGGWPAPSLRRRVVLAAVGRSPGLRPRALRPLRLVSVAFRSVVRGSVLALLRFAPAATSPAPLPYGAPSLSLRVGRRPPSRPALRFGSLRAVAAPPSRPAPSLGLRARARLAASPSPSLPALRPPCSVASSPASRRSRLRSRMEAAVRRRRSSRPPPPSVQPLGARRSHQGASAGFCVNLC